MTQIRFTLLAAVSMTIVAACANKTGNGETAGQDTSRERIIVTGSRIESGVQDAAAPVEAFTGVSPAPSPPPPPVMSAPAAKMAAAGVVRPMPQPRPGDVDRDKYEDVKINPVKLVSEEAVSTFSIDVDTASYANIRSYLGNGALPPKDAVRIEEVINYFDYGYAPPKSKAEPFSTTVKVVPSPWAKGRQLMHIGLQGYEIKAAERPPLNLTLLVDVSGSMNQPNKLPLAKNALKLLVDQMDEKDRISIAVYAGAAGTVLEPTSGADKAKIIAAFDQLSAGGSTAGGEGLRLAYSLAKQNFDKTSVNRVMILTDGDFNVGINDPNRLEDFVSRERESGVYLSVLGFGRGNYNDALMQKLAQAGNGMASYIDTLNEARKVLSDDLSGSMFPIANDVKIQVEFNPATVAEYRLIGYETRLLNREDFNNDKVDAGEIGAGHSVTAIYELTPVGSSARMIDASRYQTAAAPADRKSTEFAFLRMRYKLPGEDTSKLIERAITPADAVSDLSRAPESTRFATAAAAYGSLLRGDPYLEKAFGWDSVIALAQAAKGSDEFGYRAEFINLARLAKTAASQEALQQPGSVGN